VSAPDRLIDRGKTPWTDIQEGGKTIAPISAKSVQINVPGNAKRLVDVIPSVRMVGTKLPLIHILNGTMSKMGTHLGDRSPNQVSYSANEPPPEIFICFIRLHARLS
jgi:hypothetical protein